MTTQEILKLCGKGEQTPVQLKERVVDNYEVGKEMVCYANSLGQLEIPFDALSEICSNALLHRSYSREAPVRLFIFDNRVEIHSPGILPGGLQVEDVLMGTSFPRNRMVFTHGAFLLPYTGVGSGFIRVRELDEKIDVLNDEKRKEVVVTFWRESNQESVRPGVRVTEKSDRVTEKSVRPSDGPGVRAKAILTSRELDIVNYCTVPRTSKEILARVGVSYHSKNLARYVKSLVNMGFLKLTIPETPNAPNQKYVKV